MSANRYSDVGLRIGANTGDFSKGFIFPVVRKAELRISIKDLSRNKSLEVALASVPFFWAASVPGADGREALASASPVTGSPFP